MKILSINSWIHHKNLNFILKCKKIDFHIINNVNEIDNHNLDEYDAIYSSCDAIDVKKYPNSKFIFGPHFSVFPDERINLIKGPKTVYNLLSNWVINCWKQFPLCNNLNLVALPFGVDTEKFIDVTPIHERNNVMIYFKHRHPADLYKLETFLQEKQVKYEVFSYDKMYDENDYINYLQKSKYCIVVDAHESQGFALQEALSCNVPLLVWNVSSLNQEYGSNLKNLEATTTSYWDSKCGEIFYNIDELESIYNIFINNIEKYKPREFIVDNLSVEACENRLIEFIQKM